MRTGFVFYGNIIIFATLINIIMALVIASVPVLTGEVAEKFESQAEKTYEEYLKRASEEKNEDVRYEQGIQMVRSILAKSKLKGV